MQSIHGFRCSLPAARHFSPSIRRLSSTKSYVNPDEVAHFNDLAASWWDPHGPSRLLRQMNPLRHDFISSCLATGMSQRAKLRYLDIGCGGGIFAESAARLPNTDIVTAIDPSSEVIAEARRHAAVDPSLQHASQLRYVNTGIEDLPVPTTAEEGVDILALWEVIEHVNHPASFLRACMPHVKPGGWLVLSSIARTWPSWLLTKLMAEDLLRIVPRGTHDWSKYLDVAELERFFEAESGWAAHKDGIRAEGCLYVPGLGWKFVAGSEQWGNYFFGVRKDG